MEEQLREQEQSIGGYRAAQDKSESAIRDLTAQLEEREAAILALHSKAKSLGTVPSASTGEDEPQHGGMSSGAAAARQSTKRSTSRPAKSTSNGAFNPRG